MLCHWRYVLDNLFGEVKAVSCLGATHIPSRVDERGQTYAADADDGTDGATREEIGGEGEEVRGEALMRGGGELAHWVYLTIGLTWGGYACLKKWTTLDAFGGLFVEPRPHRIVGRGLHRLRYDVGVEEVQGESVQCRRLDRAAAMPAASVRQTWFDPPRDDRK